MTAHPKQPLKQQVMRKYAEDKLKEGSALPTFGWPTSLDALSLLHKLASSPVSAGDAIKLYMNCRFTRLNWTFNMSNSKRASASLPKIPGSLCPTLRFCAGELL